MNWLKEKVKWMIAGQELRQLHHLKTDLHEYRRWLAEFPGLAFALDHLAKMNGISTIDFDDVRCMGIFELRDHIRTLPLSNVKQQPVCWLDGDNGTSFAVYTLPPDVEAYKKQNAELRNLLMSAAAKLQVLQRLIESIWVTEDDLHILSKIEAALESDEP